MKLKIVESQHTHKIGINEIVGLKEILKQLMAPIQDLVKGKIYWSSVELGESEYVGRDGFIPHGHNCGGIEISGIVPSVEQYGFEYLSFGECDVCGTAEYVNEIGEPIQCGYAGMDCALEADGHLYAKLRVWLKFEGINSDNEMDFYLYMGGGNGDAPYFRTKYEETIFEKSFSCKTLAELKREGQKHIKELLKVMV